MDGQTGGLTRFHMYLSKAAKPFSYKKILAECLIALHYIRLGGNEV